MEEQFEDPRCAVRGARESCSTVARPRCGRVRADAEARVRYDGGLLSLDGWLAPASNARRAFWVAGTSRATVRRAAKDRRRRSRALGGRAARARPRLRHGRTMLRISASLRRPKTGEDERGRHAIEGPPEWIAERLADHVEAGCDGFVVNLGHDAPELEDRARRFQPKWRRSLHLKSSPPGAGRELRARAQARRSSRCGRGRGTRSSG